MFEMSEMFRMDEQISALSDVLSEDELRPIIKASIKNPLKYFCPNGAQEQFIKTVANSINKTRVPVILSTFANGVGKTTVSIMVMLNIIYSPQNAWFDYPLYHNYPFPKKIWYASTVEAIKEVIVPMIEAYAKPGTFRILKEGKAYASKIIFNYDGKTWILVFKTFDQDPKQYESDTVGLFIIDEPMPETLWKASKSRRRLGCVTMLPMTPLLCPPYVLDEIKKNAEAGADEYFHLMADVYQACKVRGVRGHLEPDIIDSMVEGYDEEEREARAFGEFMYFSGTIYPELNKEKHFVDPAKYPIPMYSQIFEVKDPHDGRPSAIIWGAKTPGGRFIIFKELPANQSMPFWKMTTPISAKDEIRQIFETENEFLAQMNAPVKNLNYQFEINRRILDKRFGWQKRAGTTLSALYMKEATKLANEYPMFRHKQMVYVSSYDAPAGEGEIAFGHERVRDSLADMADGKPGLVIYNTCYHTWNGLTHYIKQKRTGKSAEGFATGDGKILAKYKDLPDAVRYFICSNVLKSDVPTERMSSHQKQKQIIMNMPNKDNDYTHS